LAPTAAEQSAPDPEVELFCMAVAGDRFATEASLIHEVVRLPPITPLPGAPPFLLGIIAHRGEVLPVLDVSRVLGRGETRPGSRSRVAVARVDGMAVALLTDSLIGLIRRKLSQIERAPVGVAQRGAEFVSGVVADAGSAIAILDLRRLVASARSRVIGE
jgi:purine-binding chemotaxis protein CheW